MFSFTLDIYCTSVRPGRGIPHMWLSLRFLLSFYLLKGFFSSFSFLLLRVKGRGCHTLLKPYETNCGLWIWAIQIQFDWLIDWLITRNLSIPGINIRPETSNHKWTAQNMLFRNFIRSHFPILYANNKVYHFCMWRPNNVVHPVWVYKSVGLQCLWHKSKSTVLFSKK